MTTIQDTINQYHDFRPMRSNRTRCDICGRTAGVQTHGTRPTPTLTVKVPLTVVVDLDSWTLNYGGWDMTHNDVRGMVIEDVRSEIEMMFEQRGVKVTVR